MPTVSDLDSRRDGARPPLVLHLVYRFDTGGLENGVVNLINAMPASAYRHAVVALTEVVPAFAARIRRNDVAFASLHKPPGHGARLYPRLARLFREMRPAIVHTRNLAALECQVPAAWAGVPVRVHGEHGRDVEDLDGSSRRHQWIRRAYRPFVHRYVALSKDLEHYLVDRVGIGASRVTQIYNGVDTVRFHPVRDDSFLPSGFPFRSGEHWTVGTVGRLQPVKHQTLLARAFVRVLKLDPTLRSKVRLAIVGDGPLRDEVGAILTEAGISDLVWLPGERHDVAEVMRTLDCFVLPSLAEGVSNTILEAMSTGLPVIATRVGGNAELVADGESGLIVPPSDVDALAQSILQLIRTPVLASRLGARARSVAVSEFSLEAMTRSYQDLYTKLLSQKSYHV